MLERSCVKACSPMKAAFNSTSWCEVLLFPDPKFLRLSGTEELNGLPKLALNHPILLFYKVGCGNPRGWPSWKEFSIHLVIDPVVLIPSWGAPWCCNWGFVGWIASRPLTSDAVGLNNVKEPEVQLVWLMIKGQWCEQVFSWYTNLVQQMSTFFLNLLSLAENLNFHWKKSVGNTPG